MRRHSQPVFFFLLLFFHRPLHFARIAETSALFFTFFFHLPLFPRSSPETEQVKFLFLLARSYIRIPVSSFPHVGGSIFIQLDIGCKCICSFGSIGNFSLPEFYFPAPRFFPVFHRVGVGSRKASGTHIPSFDPIIFSALHPLAA